MGVDVNVDVEFRRKIMDAQITARLMYCYQCNHCTYECPVSDVVGSDVYNPRKLILYSFLGLKGNIIGKKENAALWACTTCDTCDEVCPNDIELTHVFYTLRNMAVKAKEAPEAYLNQAKAIMESGKTIPKQPAIQRRREQMNLKDLPDPALDEVQTIFKELKLDEVLK